MVKDLEWFEKSLSESNPPRDISPYLVSLWHDGKGDWDTSHDIAQDLDDQNGSWIHAYLHRKEGDQFNANYWYRRAGKTMPDSTLDQEWNDLVNYFLAKC